jgi:phage tail-like protein
MPASRFRLLVDTEPRPREIAVARISPLVLGEAEVGPEERPDQEGAEVPATVVFARALDHDRFVYDWRRAFRENGAPRLDLIVELRELADDAREPPHRFELRGCRPLRWTGPAFDAEASALAMERLEVAYRDLIWTIRQEA